MILYYFNLLLNFFPMKKNKLILTLGCVLFVSLLFVQDTNKLGNRLIVGTSLTYIWETNDDLPNTYHEFTWNKNVAVNLNKYIYLGISHLNINTRGSIFDTSKSKNNYYLTGIFSQFDFLPSKKERLFIEGSWNYGNYCTCGNEDPFREGGLHYLGIGLGYDYPIYKNISLDLSFVGYKPLNATDKYTYTQYVIGLNFDLMR